MNETGVLKSANGVDTFRPKVYCAKNIKSAMLIRISLILTIVAALAVGVVNFAFVKDKIDTLVTDRNTQRDGRLSAEGERDRTKKELAQTKNDLEQTRQQLTDAESQRDSAVANADAQTKRADQLSDQLAKTTQERNDAQDNLAAYKATGMSPDQVSKLTRSLKDEQDLVAVANQENAVLRHARDRLKAELSKFEGDSPDVVLRADLKGKVIVVDPKWDFVVLNIGEDQGVLPDGELLVSRDGKLVAKVVVHTIEKDRSIANVVPGWKLGEMFEGDEVSPAHPAS
jgi:hypothetical protein